MILIDKIIKQISVRYHYLKQSNSVLGSGDIQFYNWWPAKKEELWLYQYILNKNKNSQVAFCSVFGNQEILKFINKPIKIFYTGENLHTNIYSKYAGYLLEDESISLTLGFDLFEHERYLRFPLWLMYMFSPNINEKEIIDRCNTLRFPEISLKTKFASMISRYDILGIRSDIVNSLSNVGKIDCPSNVLYNDSSLKDLFNDNKRNYLMQYYFNICPENTNAYGYVTEKIFEAIDSGCIPIYWGSYNEPEKEILNKDAVLFWEPQKDNSKIIDEIKYLYNNKNALVEFLRQPRLLDGAENKIYDIFRQFEDMLDKLYNGIII